MFTVDNILKAINMAGSALPAFKALFDAAVSTFGEKDQDTLKSAYAEQIAKSDELHRQVQEL